MSAVRFSKQYVQPKPHEVDYWVDLATNPYGAVIKYYNGDDWEQWEGSGGQSSNFDVYTKKQINEMLAKKANVGDVDSKVDDDELAEVIKNIKIKEIGNDGVALVLFKYDNTNLAVTLPTATATNAGVLSGKDFANFVKQHQLQALYSEMYDLFADIRSKYQRKLKAGKNIKITSDNVISAEINVGPGSYDAALNELDEKINIETERAIAVEDRLEKRVDQHYVETDNLFVLKANKADVYTKSQVNDKLTGVYKVKGSKTYEKLPTSNSVGDVYNITNQFTLNGTTYPAGTNVVYTEYGWDALSGNFDVTALEEDIQTVADDLSKETLRAIEAETYNSNSIIDLTNTAAALNSKINSFYLNTYTIGEVDDIVAGYLPLKGGTLNGQLILDHDYGSNSNIIFKNNRLSSEQTSNSADNVILINDATNATVGRLGVYGITGVISYIHMGLNAYNGNNLRIYADKLTFGDSQLAYLTSNVASATKLATARTIWGQSFDGTGDISGNVIIDNNRGVNIKDTGGTSRTALFVSDSNNLHLGYGQSVAGYNTYIDGNNIYLRYGTSNTTGIELTSAGRVSIKGNVDIPNNKAIYFKDSKGTDIQMLYAQNNNDFILGGGTCSKKYWTLIKGYKIAFYTAESGTMAMRINDSGNITIGSSDLASTTYKLYVDGMSWFNSQMNVVGNFYKYNAARTYRLSLINDSDYCSIYNIKADGSAYGNLVFKGNIGIGTTRPLHKLHVEGTVYATKFNMSSQTADVTGIARNWADAYPDSASNVRPWCGLSTVPGMKNFEETTLASYFGMQFKTGGSAFPFIFDGGKIGIWTNTPTEALHVNGNILATGTINQESQRDLKNIIDEKVLSLDDMNTINPTRFTWKDNRDEDIHYGGIAEDIQQVIPEVVHKSGDNLTVEYANAAFAMVTSLVKHVKDLEQRLSKLEEDYKQLLLNSKQ